MKKIILILLLSNSTLFAYDTNDFLIDYNNIILEISNVNNEISLRYSDVNNLEMFRYIRLEYLRLINLCDRVINRARANGISNNLISYVSFTKFKLFSIVNKCERVIGEYINFIY